MLGFGIIIPHLAYYADDLGASPTQIGGLMAIYSAMQLIFSPMWGRMSDRRGRKPAILIGLIGNAGALALFGAATTLNLRNSRGEFLVKPSVHCAWVVGCLIGSRFTDSDGLCR